MKTKLFILLTVLAVLGIDTVASAIQISVNATAQTTRYGYTADQSYTLTIELSDSFSGAFMAGEDLFLPGYGNAWSDQDGASLYTSASGTALSESGSLDPAQQILLTTGSNWLTVIAENLEGFTMLDGTAVDGITSGTDNIWQLDGISFAELSSEVAPTDYLAQYAGTYTCSYGELLLNNALSDSGTDDMVFDVTSVTITPEPATMALLGLGGLMLRRRCKA